jgi:hypothetical protein
MWFVRDLSGKIDELVRGLAHRRNDDDQALAGVDPRHDPLGDLLDPLGVTDRGSAVLLDYERHAKKLDGVVTNVKQGGTSGKRRGLFVAVLVVTLALALSVRLVALALLGLAILFIGSRCGGRGWRNGPRRSPGGRFVASWSAVVWSAVVWSAVVWSAVVWSAVVWSAVVGVRRAVPSTLVAGRSRRRTPLGNVAR